MHLIYTKLNHVIIEVKNVKSKTDSKANHASPLLITLTCANDIKKWRNNSYEK